MADLALGGLGRIFRACLEIKKAAETVQQNKKECRDIQRCVNRVTGILAWLKESTMNAVMHPSFSGPLDDLAESMEEALELITDCRQRSALHHLWGARDMAKQLRRAHDDIMSKVILVILATNVQIRVYVTPTHCVGARPPLLPQDAGRLSSNISHSTTDDVRSNMFGSSSDITMLTGGCEGPYPSSSRTESMLFEQDTAHYVSIKEKIVIKLSFSSYRSRRRAMTLTASFCGVSSTAITGDAKDRLEVVGDSVDVVRLITCLRKKIGFADILLVEELKENKLPMSISPVENTDSDHFTTDDVARSGVNSELTRVATGNGMAHGPSSRLPDFEFSELEATTHYFSEENIHVEGGPSLREKILTPRGATDEDNRRFNHPLSEESPLSSPCPPTFKGKGKQTLPLPLAQTHHQEVRPHPHVAAPVRPDGPSPRGIMAHLRAAAAGLKASRLSALHEWLVASTMPAYGIIFVLLFLLFLRMVISSNS